MNLVRITRVLVTLSFILPWAAAAAPSERASGYMAAEPFAGKKVRLDGALLEWPGGFSVLHQKVSGTPVEAEALVGYDDRFLYLGAKVKDPQIVRSKAAGSAEDHLSLDLYFPAAEGAGQTHRIDVYPGDPGKLAGLVKIDGKLLASAQAIEAPDLKGFVLEAQIPWSAFAEAATVRVGLRAKLSYIDASGVGQVRGVVSTSSANGSKLPPLTLEPETGLIQALLEPKNLSLVPAREVYGDLTGKAELERVALYGHFLSITGPGYRDGKQFYFNELDVPSADQVTLLELRDFNGDGKSEIVLGKRLGTGLVYREVVQVLQIGADGAPLQIFIHETALVTREGRVVNELKLEGKGKEARLRVSQGTSSGFDPATFQEPTIGVGIPSALLPWQAIGAQVYGWQGQGLALLEEKPFKPRLTTSPKGSSQSGRKSASPSTLKAPAPPRPPTADEMLDRVYALYRKDRGLGNKKPRFDFACDVVEDDQSERVLVHDKDVVVFGKGFKSGSSYASISVGVKDPRDILAVTALDLTGDGKAEIVVHAVLEAQASKQLGGDVVQRQALFVYSMLGETLTRVFAAETARTLGKNRISDALRFTPSARGVAISIGALSARGWNEKTYPFPEDTSPAGGLEPLLLPWGVATSRHYEFDGKSFVAR